MKYRKKYDHHHIENEAILNALRIENKEKELQLNDQRKEINWLVKLRHGIVFKKWSI